MSQPEEDLGARLARYPVDRYPVQHATTQFHLGSVLLQSGETDAALHALSAAREVFGHAGMRLEQAKATVMLGVALRTRGRFDQAAAAFTSACAELAELDQPTEQAAASYNLGLVLQDVGDLAAAGAAWTQARELFLAAGYPAQAAAAARDHGACLLRTGQVEQALALLEQATSLAEQARDETGVGAAANALGLAHLAAHQPAEAVTALRRALAAFPRTVRPDDYAMVKANMALAYEQAGAEARARIAANQALAVHSAPAPVRAQTEQLLARLPGSAPEDLLSVLDDEQQDSWGAAIREEMVRAAEVPAVARRAIVSGFLDGVLTRPEVAYELAESLLQVILELPPRPYDLLLSAVVDSCAGRPDDDTARLRAVIGSAMARFAMPQWQRLAASLNAAAQDAGLPAGWA